MIVRDKGIKMKKIILSHIGLIILLLAGCGVTPPEMYGIRVNYFKSNAFELNPWTPKTGITFSKSDIAHDDVNAIIQHIYNPWITLSVFNNSKVPIKTNYFLDNFVAYDFKGNKYDLDAEFDQFYPKGSINPMSSAQFRFAHFPSPLIKNGISEIRVTLFGRTKIILKPVPIKDDDGNIYWVCGYNKWAEK